MSLDLYGERATVKMLTEQGLKQDEVCGILQQARTNQQEENHA